MIHQSPQFRGLFYFCRMKDKEFIYQGQVVDKEFIELMEAMSELR